MPGPTLTAPPQIARPHPLLATYVHRYVEVRFHAGTPVIHRISALGAPVFVLTLSGNAWFGTDETSLQPIPFANITGPLVSSALNRYEGAMHGFLMRFTPWGMRALLGVWGAGLASEMSEAEDAVAPHLRPLVNAWIDRLAGAPDFASRVALADAFLLDRLRDIHRLPRTVLAALRTIERTSGALPVARLARSLETPESTLRRQIVETTGASPKLHAQIIRFRHTWHYLRTAPGATWADAVTRFGYTDQAHFIHEHRRFSGETPTALDASERFMDRSMGLGDDQPLG